MQRSRARILTTHTGSLPRPPALVQLVACQEQREVRTHPDFASQVHAAVAEVVTADKPPSGSMCSAMGR